MGAGGRWPGALRQAQTRRVGSRAPPPPQPGHHHHNEQQRGQDGEAKWACFQEMGKWEGCCWQRGAGPRGPGWQRADTDRQHGTGVQLRSGSAPPSGPWAGAVLGTQVPSKSLSISLACCPEVKGTEWGPASTARLFSPATHLGGYRLNPEGAAEGRYLHTSQGTWAHQGHALLRWGQVVLL